MRIALFRRFLLASLTLGLWAAIVLVVFLVRAFETRDAAHAAATAQIARGRLSALVDREVGLVLALADAAALRAWSGLEASAAHKAAALKELDRFRKRFQSREAFLAHEASGQFYFLEGASTPSNLAPKYTLQKDKPADDWFFSPAWATKAFKLNVDQDRELKVTRLWINAVIR